MSGEETNPSAHSCKEGKFRSTDWSLTFQHEINSHSYWVIGNTHEFALAARLRSVIAFRKNNDDLHIYDTNDRTTSSLVPLRIESAEFSSYAYDTTPTKEN